MKVVQESHPDALWTATINVGTNAKENDALFAKAQQNDWWFHLDKGPSCHVYLHTEGKLENKDEKMLFAKCKQLVKENSKCRTNAKVISTRKRNIRRNYSQSGAVILKNTPDT